MPPGGTVSIGGKQVPKVAVGGAAVAAGYVGWRWFMAGREPANTTASDPLSVDASPVDVPTDSTSFDMSGNVVPTSPTTNADWVQLAIERAVAVGFDGVALAAALGKYLARQPLTPTEANLVRTAIAQAGLPPQNTPAYTIIEAGQGGVTPISTRPSAPSSVRASVSGASHIHATWSAVKGATSYEVALIRGYPQGEAVAPYRSNGLSTAATFTQMPTKDATYTVEVRAVNSSGPGPHKRSNPVKIHGR